jgi:HAD superfamily hydrolase (TIGR01458 family)
MACILLDVDGVLHVSGEPIPGAVEAVERLRQAGHSLRYVTNNSTTPRARLAKELRRLGFPVEDEELQTTPRTAARELAGKRVYALVMSAIVPELDGIELVGEGADAVLVGGCDESVEPNQVYSYMNLARAFSEVLGGAELVCLHKNPWWQTSRGPMLDGGAFVAGLEYATERRARTLGKPSPIVFRQAVAGLLADLGERLPRSAFAMVGDDPQADVAAAQRVGLRGILVLSGKTTAEEAERLPVASLGRGRRRGPDAIAATLADVVAALD